MGKQFLCYAVVERPELTKVVYKGPAENVILLMTHNARLEFSHSKEPRTTIYKGATIPLVQVDSFAPCKMDSINQTRTDFVTCYASTDSWDDI